MKLKIRPSEYDGKIFEVERIFRSKRASRRITIWFFVDRELEIIGSVRYEVDEFEVFWDES